MDLKQSDLGLLLALDALLAEGSVTGAAKRLNISQPAFSAQLSRLRKLFNDPLMVPSGRRMVPTPRALSLRDPLGIHLRALSDLVSEHVEFDPLMAAMTFRLAGTDYAHTILSKGFARFLAEAAPKTRLALLSADADRLWLDLETGRADAAIVTSLVVLNEAMSRFLFREDFVIVQRKGHPEGGGPIDLDGFCRRNHLLVSPEGGGFVGAVDQVLENLGRARNVVISVPGFLLAPAIVQTSDLICLFPRRLALAFSDMLDILPLPFEMTGFDMQLIWHPRRQNDPAHVWFRNRIVDQCKTVTVPA